MIQKEQTVYPSCYYLYQKPSLSSGLPSPQVVVDDAVCKTMVNWCFSFVNIFNFERKTVTIAMEMFNCFLSKSNKEQRLCYAIIFNISYLPRRIYLGTNLYADGAPHPCFDIGMCNMDTKKFIWDEMTFQVERAVRDCYVIT